MGATSPRKGRKLISFLFENSIFLILGCVAALIWANSAGESYHHFHKQADFLINDVGMAFFFAIAGKEIWEALLPGGALSSVKKAATPLIATLGGITGPALVFTLGAWYLGRADLYNGWAIPTATDIAFSYLVARLVFGKGHPAIAFLLLLAVADDAAGLMILAIFYPTGEGNFLAMAGLVGAAIVIGLVLNRKFKVANFWPYILIPGVLSFYGFHLGGIHPALSLVPIIPTIPHGHTDWGMFSEESHEQQDPLNRFEEWFKRPVELILGLFGLLNAGVVLSNVGVTTWLVVSALIIGKITGITLFTRTAMAAGLSLPEGMNFRELIVLSCAAAIGFTVALFVSTVAFDPGPIQDAAKMGALFSFSAALITWVVAKFLGVKPTVQVVGASLSLGEPSVPVPLAIGTSEKGEEAHNAK